MSGWIPAVLGLLFVINPPGVSHLTAWAPRADPGWRRTVLPTLAGATVVLAVLVAFTGPLLDLLDLSVPTFRLGASVVMGITGARWLVAPGTPIRSVETHREGLTYLALSLLAPGPVFGAMVASADAGWVAGLVAVVVAGAGCALTLLSPRLSDYAGAAAARLLGAATIVVAVAVGIDSARTV